MGLYAMAEYPEIKQRLVDELKFYIKSDEEVTYENLQVNKIII